MPVLFRPFLTSRQSPSRHVTRRTEEAKKLAQDLMKRGRLDVSIAEIENLSTDRLMRLLVEQLEIEKQDLNEQLCIEAKRIDHVERAYRKEERPLLAQEYAEQQATDRAIFEELQKARVENSLAAHNQAVATKKRLGRMQGEFKAHRETLLAGVAARSEEYNRRKAIAEQKMEEEKEKRRQAHVAQQEARRKEREEAEEERLRAEAEQRAAKEAEAERKRQEKERVLEQRRQRKAERAAAVEEARKNALRVTQGEVRARLRSQAKTTGPTVPRAEGAWRSRLPAQASDGPSRPESPAPSPLNVTGPAKFGGAGGGGGGWRRREAEKAKVGPGGGLPARAESPKVTSPSLLESKKEADGFETVPEKVWRPKRLQGQS